MFNVTGGELFMILLVALIVLGPERLPSAARRVGKVMGQLRDLSEGFKREMSQALDDPGEPIVKPATRPQLTALDGGAQAGAAQTGGAQGAAPSDRPLVQAGPSSADEAEAVATAEVVPDSVSVGDSVSDVVSPTVSASTPTAAPTTAAAPTVSAPPTVTAPTTATAATVSAPPTVTAPTTTAASTTASAPMTATAPLVDVPDTGASGAAPAMPDGGDARETTRPGESGGS